MEFAFTLAASVTVSAVIALTLSPMTCMARLKTHPREAHEWETRLVRFIDARFEKLLHWYQHKLERSLRYTPVTAVLVLLVLGIIYFMYSTAKSELAPQEDQGFVLLQATTPPNATLQAKSLYDEEGYRIASATAHPDHTFQIDTAGQALMGLVLPPRNKRTLGASAIQQQLQRQVATIAGQKNAVFQPPSLPGAFGLPVQFAITTTEPAHRLNEVSQEFLEHGGQERHVHVQQYENGTQ